MADISKNEQLTWLTSQEKLNRDLNGNDNTKEACDWEARFMLKRPFVDISKWLRKATEHLSEIKPVKYVGLQKGKLHDGEGPSEYYCGGCGYPVTDHDSYCRECGGAFQKSFAKRRGE